MKNNMYPATNGNACTCVTDAIISSQQIRKKPVNKFKKTVT